MITFRYEFTNLSGTPVTEADVGEILTLTAFVSHTAADPTGVFAGFLDVFFPSNLVPVGNINRQLLAGIDLHRRAHGKRLDRLVG